MDDATVTPRAPDAIERSRFDPRDLGVILIVACIYVAAAKLGLSLSVAHGNATPVWAPAGISLAVLVLFGRRYWPGVLLGAFVANVTTPIPVWAALLIGIGNTLEALLGAILLRRVGFRPALDRGRDVLTLATLGGIVAPIVSATVGVSALTAAGEIASGDLWFHWSVWWIGDAMGIVLLASLLMSWFSDRSQLSMRDIGEAFVILAGVIVVGAIVFSREPPAASFLVFPLIVWSTLRFGQRGATASVVVTTAFGIAAILGGARPFGGVTATESVALLQALMSLLAISSLVVAASISERTRAEDALRAEAERSVAHEARLEEAQRVAHVGSWEWDLTTGRVEWSSEMFRIYGYDPGAFQVTFERALEPVLDIDRATIQASVERGMAATAPSDLPPTEYRITLPDGEERILRGEGRIVFDGGSPTRMIGTVQDVTERRRAQANEARLREVEENHQKALELNDEVIQGLAVAKMALELGQVEDAQAAIDSTLDSARGIVTDLLSQNGESKAGGFRRERAAGSKK